jgi:hypothetical protein
MACFCIFFHVDIASVNVNDTFNHFHLLDNFKKDERKTAITIEMWNVIAAMLGEAVDQLIMRAERPISMHLAAAGIASTTITRQKHKRRRSLSLDTQLSLLDLEQSEWNPHIIYACFSVDLEYAA